MHIVIDDRNGNGSLDIHIHSNGTVTVRVDSAHAGSGRWTKDGNHLHIELPSGAMRRDDNQHGMSFEFEER